MSQLSDAAVEALGGAVGSAIAFGLTYPLQTISTWQSLETSDTRVGPDRGNSLLTKLIPSPLQLLYHHALEPEGPSRLYAGIKPFLVGTVISQGLYFYLYSTLRGWVVAARSAVTGNRAGPARTQDIGILGSIVVASLAGCINVMATSPVWVIVTQQQKAAKSEVSDDEPRPTALERVIRVYQEGGLKAFWKGAVASLFMVSNPTIQFILYEWLISRLRDLKTRRAARAGAKVAPPVTATDAFLMSAVAKLGATLATYPMLVVKSRMQAGSSSSQGAQEQQYKSVWDALARIVEAEGFQGLFKGMKAKMLQTVLGAALLMAIKEQVYTSIKALRAAAASSRKAAALIKG